MCSDLTGCREGPLVQTAGPDSITTNRWKDIKTRVSDFTHFRAKEEEEKVAEPDCSVTSRKLALSQTLKLPNKNHMDTQIAAGCFLYMFYISVYCEFDFPLQLPSILE